MEEEIWTNLAKLKTRISEDPRSGQDKVGMALEALAGKCTLIDMWKRAYEYERDEKFLLQKFIWNEDKMEEDWQRRQEEKKTKEKRNVKAEKEVIREVRERIKVMMNIVKTCYSLKKILQRYKESSKKYAEGKQRSEGKPDSQGKIHLITSKTQFQKTLTLIRCLSKS